MKYQSFKEKIEKNSRKDKKFTSDYRVIFRKTCKYVFSQIICVKSGRVLFGISGSQLDENNKTKQASLVAQKISEYIKENNLTSTIFDRMPYRYHGNVKTFVEAVRNTGVNI